MNIMTNMNNPMIPIHDAQIIIMREKKQNDLAAQLTARLLILSENETAQTTAMTTFNNQVNTLSSSKFLGFKYLNLNY